MLYKISRWYTIFGFTYTFMKKNFENFLWSTLLYPRHLQCVHLYLDTKGLKVSSFLINISVQFKLPLKVFSEIVFSVFRSCCQPSQKIIESWMENKFEVSPQKSKWKEGRKEGSWRLARLDREMRLNMKRCQINKNGRRRENFNLDLIPSSNVSD